MDAKQLKNLSRLTWVWNKEKINEVLRRGSNPRNTKFILSYAIYLLGSYQRFQCLCYQ